MRNTADALYEYLMPRLWARPWDVEISRYLPSGDVTVDLLLWKQNVALVCSNIHNFPVEEYEREYPDQRVYLMRPGDLLIALQHDMLASVISMNDGESLLVGQH